jgi:hypothetical protein
VNDRINVQERSRGDPKPADIRQSFEHGAGLIQHSVSLHLPSLNSTIRQLRLGKPRAFRTMRA